MWKWDRVDLVYRDDETGKILSRDRALAFVDQSLAAGGDAVDGLASLMANSQLSPADWHERMQREIKGEYIRQYLLGRGGLEQMEQADWGSVGGMIAEQYRPYLTNFAGEVSGLSEGQILVRARMYINSAREAFERGKARSQGMPFGALPAYPADGQTVCLTEDRCSWEIETIRDAAGNIIRWDCYWRLDSAAQHCSSCLDNAATYSPFVVEA